MSCDRTSQAMDAPDRRHRIERLRGYASEWLLKSWRTLPASVRHVILKAVQRNHRLDRWLGFRHVDAEDRMAGIRANVPPAELRYRVGGSTDAAEFVEIGKTCADDMQSALWKVGRELRSFTRILDFGCGCGRTLVHLQDRAPTARIEGVDIDAKAIKWCRRHLHPAEFSLSKETPPIDYFSETFDFIYAISVFTHL